MKSDSSQLRGIPVMLFKTQKAWAAWLEKNHTKSSGVWLRLAKKGSEVKSLSYVEGVEVALCYGWIDGQKESYDDSSWLQKFTPRGARSIWSKINREKAQELIKSGQMKLPGLEAIEKARQNGRWEAAYDSPSGSTVPRDFEAALEKSPAAKAFFATINRANRYAILFRIQTAKKAETRARRIKDFISMLENKETLH
jgi:uncharacterized protein YdeI (YjbR/CyaY-like superfamily)